VLFDLDGTLVDREHLLGSALAEVMAVRGRPMTIEAIRSFVGASWCDVYERLEVEDALDVPFEDWHAEVLDVADGLAAAGFAVRRLDGAVELLRRLAATEVVVGIVTGSTRRELAEAADELDIAHLLAVTVGAEDYARGKPAPDAYLTATTELGLDPTRCVAVEDSTVGVAAAVAAGLAVVGTTEANEGTASEQDLGAAHLVSRDLASVSIAELARLVAC
jgi:beta-phosphoglucomutase-like phosphatase (HAD superfamily)